MIQKSLLKGITPITFAFDKMSQNESDKEQKSMTEMIAYGVALLAHGSHSLDVFRLHSFKGEIKEDSSSLCQGTYPVEGSFFEHNVQEKIKEINESLWVA
ncbi:hypothetical protein PoB_006745000 [Plakobranchus ocellatus]|uniref:Uncharacterized protein n=1 Tax=Plakobranchus ocellatus TaxID=259542 RepID=A0AAV4DA32_9GAST|nr:hypothetical protein PoB_006745000 [Plakobranchus ocellatus]